MSFAFNNIILNQLPLTQSAGRLYINGNPIAFSSEAAGGVTGLTVASGDARYVQKTGSQYISGELSVGNSSKKKIDTATHRIHDSDDALSIEWVSRNLHDNNEAITLDWQNKSLDGGNWTVSSGLYVAGGIVNSTGGAVVDFLNGYLYAVTLAVDWGERYLHDYSGLYSVAWQDRVLFTSNENDAASLDWGNRKLYTGASSEVLDWGSLHLVGNWGLDGTPVLPDHITNKNYVDSTSSYTIPFGHASFNPVDSTTYYFGTAFGVAASSSQSTSPVSAIPKSGKLKSLIGTATVAGTLGSSETVSLIVYKNGASVATGTYLMTGRNNVISSGVNNLNISVSELDTLQLSTVCPAWTTNPTSVTHSFNAYVTLG